MDSKIEIAGTVSSGLAEAFDFTQLDWVKKQCLEKLGFIPYPGTLNLKVDKDYLNKIKELKEKEGIEIIPPTPDFCKAISYKTSIEGIDIAVIIPLVKDYPGDLVEIIAPIKLKDALLIKGGDRLSISIG
jgi:CTP-dependent riboflavin kinase